MKFNIQKVLRIAFVISIIVFVIERFAFGNGFDLSIYDLLKVFSIHFMYAFSLTLLNFYFILKVHEKYSWEEESLKITAIGVFGSVLLTMIGLFILRFITLVIFLGKSSEYFLNDPAAREYYLFGLVITIVISLGFHTIYFYKALTEKKVKDQKIVAETESAKFESLKSQIDPHFLFNSLNVLTSLIAENPNQAEKFTTKLSKVYRYVLEQKNKDLINLDEELEFAKSYMELLKMRFEGAIIFNLIDKPSNPELKIIPLSLQLLLENTIKHNVVSEKNPLEVNISEENDYLVVTNNYNPKNTIEKGTKVGLKNIVDRYNLLTLKKVSIEEKSNKFIVKIPLLTKKIKQMKTSNIENSSYTRAVERVEKIKEFYSGLLAYILVNPFLIFINFTFVPQFHWFWFPLIGWGIGLAFHAFSAFGNNSFFGHDWEKRKIKEYMDKDEKQYWE